jgi:transcriptional regulator with XRE-family HTH domain
MSDEKARKSAKMKYRERRRRSNGAVISAVIKDSPKTQAQVAEEIGVSKDTMSALVGGKRKIELSDIELIARAVGVEPKWLMTKMLDW